MKSIFKQILRDKTKVKFLLQSDYFTRKKLAVATRPDSVF